MVVIQTLWGSSHSVDTKPGGVVVNGFNFAIYEKANGTFWVAVWNRRQGWTKKKRSFSTKMPNGLLKGKSDF